MDFFDGIPVQLLSVMDSRQAPWNNSKRGKFLLELLVSGNDVLLLVNHKYPMHLWSRSVCAFPVGLELIEHWGRDHQRHLLPNGDMTHTFIECILRLRDIKQNRSPVLCLSFKGLPL